MTTRTPHLSLCAALCLAALGVGCTDGVANPFLVQELGGPNGAGADGLGAAGRGIAPEVNLCPELDPDDETARREEQMFTALNEAIEDGRSCLTVPLQTSPVWRCVARGLANVVTPEAWPGSFLTDDAWVATDQGKSWLWTKRKATSQAEARQSLLRENPEFCQAASRFTYRWAGVGHMRDAWVVMVSATDRIQF
ncbi:MAG: hypothetical protein ABW321_01115 [Polyangiales bacterium]